MSITHVTEKGEILSSASHATASRANSSRHPSRRNLSLLFLTLVVCAILLGGVLHWGGYLLISDDALTAKVEGAVVLQGSVSGEKARVAGAVRVLQQGLSERVLLSVPSESYWGQTIPPIARTYIQKNYGTEVASRIEFCEMNDVDSTEQEAEALFQCIEARHWKSVAVVTSDYHTRRTGILWRRILRKRNSSFTVRICAVADPEFHANGWWRERQSAKTWVLECTKLLVTSLTS